MYDDADRAMDELQHFTDGFQHRMHQLRDEYHRYNHTICDLIASDEWRVLGSVPDEHRPMWRSI
jgi:hypothetical protein